jgi:hypothetical protein
MCCPFFLPSAPLGDFARDGMPLGDVYAGGCAAEGFSAQPIPAESIPEDTLRRCCNLGYARGVCERAGQSAADAARFLVKADRGAILEVHWSLERNHHPVGVGALEIDMDRAAVREDPLEKQARACGASYLRRIGRL